MKHRKRIKNKTVLLGLQFLLIFLVVSIGGSIIGIKFTERPQFCASCHYMRPYYDAWSRSKHNNITCVECHFEPGILSTLEGKFKAITQLAKYMTQTQGTRPWAEVSDNSCLRSGCHEKRLIQGKVKFGKINFNHAPHLLENRRGKKLRCTSCHSQVMVGSHMAVTPSTCFLCHFKGMPKGTAVGGCRTCHELPKKDIMVDGLRFNHGEYVKEGATCDNCHKDVTNGSGSVPKDRCYNCHGEKERIARYKQTTFVHLKHVTDHKIECTQCHDTIQHGAVEMAEEVGKLSCESCHSKMHGAQRDLYVGTGARGVAGKPNPMFLAKVDCEGCHIVKEHNAKSKLVGDSLVVKEIACMNCHGISVGGVLPKWQKYINERMASLQSLVPQARSRAASLASTDKKAKKRFDDAVYNLDLLKYGHGEHNISYSIDIMDSVENSLKKTINPSAPELAKRAPSQNCTVLCHITPPAKTLTFSGRQFPHGRHLVDAKLPCVTCHSAVTHKLTTVKVADCDNCHHETNKDKCQTCHKDKIQAPLQYQGKTFPHLSHINNAKLVCADCHIQDKNEKMIFRKDCVLCHEKKKPESHKIAWKVSHGKESLKKGALCQSCHLKSFCSDCHRGVAMPHASDWAPKKHGPVSIANKTVCANCHKSGFCLSCHSKKAPATGLHKNCKSCHDEKTWDFLGPQKTCQTCHKSHVKDSAPAKHKECVGCHKPHVWKPQATPGLCGQCHKKQVKHIKNVPAMSDCTTCHNPHSWKFEGWEGCLGCHDKVASDIDKGKVMPECDSCHETHVWKIPSPIKKTCVKCHEKMPGHDGEAFENCTECHSKHVWKP